jgi:hypothetical protein
LRDPNPGIKSWDIVCRPYRNDLVVNPFLRDPNQE